MPIGKVKVMLGVCVWIYVSVCVGGGERCFVGVHYANTYLV